MNNYRLAMCGIENQAKVLKVDISSEFIFHHIPGHFGCKINKCGTVIDLNRGIVCEVYDTQDYKTVSITKNGKVRTVAHHRLLALTFIDPPSYADIDKLDVNHIDGDKHNNVLENLEWCTRGQNIKHAVDTGLIKSAARIIVTDIAIDHQVVASSIEEASRVSGIPAATIQWNLTFLTNQDRIGHHQFEYEDGRLTPRALGISKINRDTYKQRGKVLIGVNSMRDLYSRFPQLTRPKNSHPRKVVEVKDLEYGSSSIYTSMRELEEDTGISRKYLPKWLHANAGTYRTDKYLVVDRSACQEIDT